MTWCVRNFAFAGTLMIIVGCASAPPEPDILEASRKRPAELPDGADELSESDARIDVAAQPVVSRSVISWTHPKSGMTITLFLGDEKPYPEEGNHSRIEVASGGSPASHLEIPSLLTKELHRSRGSDVVPRVHFSPSGQSALFEEDISDASPVYNNVLLAVDPNSGELTSRVLGLPRKPVLPYGLAAKVLSITDGEATMAFFPDKLYFKLRFDRVGDAERQLD